MFFKFGQIASYLEDPKPCVPGWFRGFGIGFSASEARLRPNYVNYEKSIQNIETRSISIKNNNNVISEYEKKSK